MRKTILTISLIAALSGLAAATHAQLVVWSSTNFVYDPLGSYGAVNDFQGGENLTMNIVTPGEGGGSSQACEITFNPGGNINFQTTGVPYPASGNTSLFLANYTLSFDMQVTGNNVSAGTGLQISLFANQAGANAFAVFGPNLLLPATVTNVFVAGVGYQHYSFPLSSFNDNGFPNVNTATNFSFGIGYVSYPSDIAAPQETFDIANLQITMATNAPPPPAPIMKVLAAKPALRVFGQNYAQPYNQEGFGTVDLSQSWVNATPSAPTSYSINIADFDTVDNYTLYVQFVQGIGSINPYVVYANANALVWSITHVGTGFTTSIAWKTNSPNSGQPNTALALTTTSTNGRGTWTLTFTTDTNGTVTAPDGTSGSFVLDPTVSAQFADPVVVCFGTAPNNTAGYGQYIDISSVLITNVAGVNESDNFTMDNGFDLTLWDPAFSLDPGSVIQVSTNTPYWVNWTVPDQGFGLGTKASLNSGTNQWFTPNYYGGGTVTNTAPTQMGPSLKWTLIPSACLPTVDGTVGGTPSKAGFFRLSIPAPIQ
jgi:hypothetical protein